MAEGQFSTLWWEPCIWCNMCGGRYGVREYQRFCIIPAAGPTHQLSLIFFASISIISFSEPSPFSLFFHSLFSLSTLPSSPLLCTRTLTVHRLVASRACVCLHMWSQKRVTGILGRLCFCVEVSMSQQDWILPWSLTLHRASCSPQLSVYIGGLPRSFPRAPKHLQLRCRREWLFGRGRRARVQPSPQNPPKVFTLANSPAQQCKSPVHPSQTSGPLSRCLDATNKLLFIY